MKNFLKKCGHRVKAFTLIEILFYFVILSVFLYIAVYFSMQILNLGQLTNNRHELQTNAEFITDKITIAIQSADAVNITGNIFDSDQGALSLVMTDASASPTNFTYSNGDILMKEGIGADTALNSDFVQVDSLNFHRVQFSKTPDQIIVEMALSVPSDIPNSRADISLHFTVSLRQ